MPGTGTAPTLEYLNPSVLQPHPKNIRTDLGDLDELAASIKVQGVLNPLTVVPATAKGKYRIVAGHRRHAAAKLAGVRPIPCLVRTDLENEADQLAAMITENGPREDLTILDEAAAFQGLLDLGDTIKSASTRTGMSQKRVRDRVKIAGAPDTVKARIVEHEITLDDAVFIASHYDTPSERALIDSYLGTGNWDWAKTRLKEITAANKKIAAVRKAAEKDKVAVADTPEERNRLIEADDHELYRKISDTWPVPGRSDLDPATVLVYLSAGAGNTAGLPYVEVFEFYNPEPQPDTITPLAPRVDADAGDPDPDTGGSADQEPNPPSAPAPTAEPPAEPTADELAAQQRQADLETAAQTRLAFLRDTIKAADPDLAVTALKTALTYQATYGELQAGTVELDLLGLADRATYLEWIDRQTTLAPLAWAMATVAVIGSGADNLQYHSLGFNDAISDPGDCGGRVFTLLPQLGYQWSEIEEQAIAEATPDAEPADE